MLVLGVITAALLATQTVHAKSKREDGKRPNIIFVFTDDMGYADIGYNDPSIYSPTINNMASHGVKLENYYVQPICSPTRGQFLTGRYQIHYGQVHGAIPETKPEGIPLDELMLPEKMKELGYNTHMVGKWHLGFFKDDYLPHKRGFDTFYGYLINGGDHYTHEGSWYGKKYLDLRNNNGPIWTENGTYSTHLFTREAMSVIEKETADKPFFLYLAYQAVHTPIQVPKKYEDMNPSITDPSRKQLAGMVSAVDEGLYNITQLLKQKGLWDNTVLIFSGDNGAPPPELGGRNWPYRGGKSSLFEGGMRVPAFVAGGYLSTASRRVTNNQLMHVSDWFPTIVEGLAGGKTNGTKPLDGFNQWDVITKGTTSPRTSLLHNIDPLTTPRGSRLYPLSFDNRMMAAIRMGDMKLITGNPGAYDYWSAPPSGGPYTVPTVREERNKNVWLFNVTADPYETNDLSATWKQQVRVMLDELQNYYRTAVTPWDSANDPRSNPALHGNVFGPWM